MVIRPQYTKGQKFNNDLGRAMKIGREETASWEPYSDCYCDEYDFAVTTVVVAAKIAAQNWELASRKVWKANMNNFLA